MRVISLTSLQSLFSSLKLSSEKEEQLLKAFIYYTVAVNSYRDVEWEEIADFSGLSVEETQAWSHFFCPLDLEEDADCLFEEGYEHEAAGNYLRSALAELLMAGIVTPIEAKIYLAHHFPASSECSDSLEDLADSFGCSVTAVWRSILHVVHALKSLSSGQYA